MSTSTSTSIREEARERCQELIREGFEASAPTLIEALPATGKSSGMVKWAAETGEPLTVFTARHELYQQYLDWAEKFGLDRDRVKRLPSFHKDCPTAHEENPDKGWRNDVRGKYREGVSGEEIHDRAIFHFGTEIPCQDGRICPYMERRDYKSKDYDLLVGRYTHAYTKKPVEGRYIAFDEFPEDDFLIEFDSSTAEQAISDAVTQIPELKVDHASEFDEKYWERGPRPEWILDFYFDREYPLDDWQPFGRYERDEAARTHITALLRTKYQGKKLENGWRYLTLPFNCVGVRNPHDKSISLLIPPPLNSAMSVIALDGTPTLPNWKSVLGPDLTIVSVHKSNKERARFLRKGLGLRLIQTTKEAKPYKNAYGNHVTPEKDLALLEAIRKREMEVPSLISSKAALKKYGRLGLDKIIDDPAEKTDYYGNLKGTNAFGTDRLGVVIGCPHPKDHLVQKWAALRGFSVKAAEDENGERKRGMATDFGLYGNPFLWALRENEVLQAAMRFGREEDEETGKRGATVYVHTAALPKWVNPDVELAKIHEISPGMEEVIKAILYLGKEDWKTTEITDQDSVTTSDQNVRTHLRKLAEWGYIEKHGEGRGRWWSDIRIGEIGEFGHVTFEPDHE